MAVGLRPLSRDDFPSLARWLSAPHVREWWRDQDVSDAHLEAKYGPRVDGADPTMLLVVEVSGAAVGMVQVCPGREYAWWPAELGLDDTMVVDGLLGDPRLVGCGQATEVLRALIAQLLPPHGCAAGLSACTRVDNLRARRLLERGGFELVHEGELARDALGPHAVYVRRAGSA